jgi:hypothetical protein
MEDFGSQIKEGGSLEVLQKGKMWPGEYEVWKTKETMKRINVGGFFFFFFFWTLVRGEGGKTRGRPYVEKALRGRV